MKDDKYFQEQLEKHMLEKRVGKIKKEIKLSMECIEYRKTKHWKKMQDRLWTTFFYNRYADHDKNVCYIFTKGFYSFLDKDVVCRCSRDFVVNTFNVKSENVKIEYYFGMVAVSIEREN